MKQGNDDAAGLLQHNLDGDDTSVDWPVQDMLGDTPSFQGSPMQGHVPTRRRPSRPRSSGEYEHVVFVSGREVS
ncbi:hypothetical protein QRX50_36835 [Amycolatopsis carbonis]|uniref:Uncharacterized protein n=1 Tax=Amycolatopsis carbonis TaxID=715471 RepID=A0A9Y2MVP5_9PSEU|nr:hypothetical protein [Amycolatopsis sp. 2-15]WIX76947.1 hypothetical protein QRX50_36835 [Amycolatopsis sp. 2-15]